MSAIKRWSFVEKFENGEIGINELEMMYVNTNVIYCMIIQNSV